MELIGSLLLIFGLLVLVCAFFSIAFPVLIFLGVVAAIAWLISEALSVPFTPTFWIVLVVGVIGSLVAWLTHA